MISLEYSHRITCITIEEAPDHILISKSFIFSIPIYNTKDIILYHLLTPVNFACERERGASYSIHLVNTREHNIKEEVIHNG